MTLRPGAKDLEVPGAAPGLLVDVQEAPGGEEGVRLAQPRRYELAHALPWEYRMI